MYPDTSRDRILKNTTTLYDTTYQSRESKHTMNDKVTQRRGQCLARHTIQYVAKFKILIF